MRYDQNGSPDLRDIIAAQRQREGKPTPEENVRATVEMISVQKDAELALLRLALKDRRLREEGEETL